MRFVVRPHLRPQTTFMSIDELCNDFDINTFLVLLTETGLKLILVSSLIQVKYNLTCNLQAENFFGFIAFFPVKVSVWL